MPPTKKKSHPTISAPTLTEAVKALRLALGDTQQQFATRLEIAISSAVRYESTRPPHGKMLAQLYSLALKNGLHRVASMFHQALIMQVGALASYKLGPAIADQALAIHNLRYGTESKEKIIQRLERALAAMQAVDPFTMATGAEEDYK
jgi:transcriptional regulator with XRE-family HTH domain